MIILHLLDKETDMGPRKMAMFSMEMGIPGIGGSLVKEETFVPSYAGTMVYFSVAGVDISFTVWI